jgi:5'-phosphate synthase pdxT subunit
MTKKEPIIGVLAIQGDVSEHHEMMEQVLKEQGYQSKVILVKHPTQVEQLDGLIIPGGESTVMSRLIAEKRFKQNLVEAIKKKAKAGMAFLGTCAGTIMLAKDSTDRVVGDFEQQLLEIMDIKVERNSYGRQQESFEQPLTIEGMGKKPYPGVFIRAPTILSTGKGVEVLAKHGTNICMAKQNKAIAVTFHPELTDDTRIHEYFLKMMVE